MPSILNLFNLKAIKRSEISQYLPKISQRKKISINKWPEAWKAIGTYVPIRNVAN